MRYLLAPVMMLLVLASCVRAQDDPKKEKPKSEQEVKFTALMEELNSAYAATQKEIKATNGDEEKSAKIFSEFLKKPPSMTPRVLEVAEKDPKSEIGAQALLFVISFAPPGPDQDKAMNLFYANHKEEVTDACMMLIDRGSINAQPFFTMILNQKDSSNRAKGFATLGSALLAKKRLAGVDPNSPDAAQFSKKAEDLFQEILNKFKDIKEIAAAADAELFILRNLSIGKVAPDIEGSDSDGKKFKLSDYRGKVVVLDFWALWCGPCMGLVPHERDLVKRLEKQPFAMVGVDFDESKDELKKGEKDHGITWRSFHDGRQGPIGEKWRISSIPAIYVLDAKGVIRFKDVREKKMDEAVDLLLKEMAATTKN